MLPTTFGETSRSQEPVEFRKTPKKAAASGWVGSALEYYDFFIYASAAALVFPKIFFPSDNPTVGIISSLATFGVGYVMRPIGAFFMGHWGDRHGRKNVLVLCMLLMGLSTFLVALLPTYAQIGILAPTLLVILRLIQGFAVSGELSGSSAMIIEHAPFGKRGFFASFSNQGAQGGQLIAAAVFLPLSAALSPDDFTAWGWRVPFLISAFVVLAGFLIRRRVDETPVFRQEEVHGKVPRAPILEVIRESWPDMVRVVFMSLANTTTTMVTTFGAVYATNSAYGNGFSTTTYLWIPVIGNALAMLTIPMVASLADRIGRKPCMFVGMLAPAVLAYPYLFFIQQHNTAMAVALAFIAWGLLYQGYNACFPAYYQELFPARTRVTGFAIAQNIGTAVTAFMPTVFASIAPPGTDVPVIVGTTTAVTLLLSAIAALTARETYRIQMDDLGEPNAVPVPRDEYLRLRAASV